VEIETAICEVAADADDDRPSVPTWRHPVLLLAAVAVAYTLVQVLAGRLDLGLSADESVYVSHFARGVPAAESSPHRSIGIMLLVAPAAMVTASVTAIRAYLSVLSGVGLFLAYLPWLRVRPGYLVPLAAGMFASLWLSVFYGTGAMPNLYIAFCAVAAVALFARSVRPGSGWGPPAGLGVAIAMLTLLRPTDAVAAVAPMLAVMLVFRRWRHARAVVAVGAGLLIGWGQWLIESYERFGGPGARLHATAQMNKTGLHILILRHLDALSGDLACDPGTRCGSVPLSALAWLTAGVLAVAVAVVTARDHQLRVIWWLCVGVAGAMAFPYVVLTAYAAPRYLLPAYALLALPAAAGVITIGTRRGRARPAVAAALSIALAAHIAIQVRFVHHFSAKSVASRGEDGAIADRLAALGVHPPCLVYGTRSPNVAFRLRCTDWDLAERQFPAAVMNRRLQDAANSGRTVAILSSKRVKPSSPTGWQRVRLWPDRPWRVTLNPPPT
jgi:hypothetical protein